MEQSPTHREPEPDHVEHDVTAAAASGPVEPVVIDLDDLEEARRDVRVSTLLKDAEAAGRLVEQEGRQGW